MKKLTQESWTSRLARETCSCDLLLALVFFSCASLLHRIERSSVPRKKIVQETCAIFLCKLLARMSRALVLTNCTNALDLKLDLSRTCYSVKPTHARTHARTHTHTYDIPFLASKRVISTWLCVYDVRARPPRSLGRHMTVPSSIWRHSSRPPTSLIPRHPMPWWDVWQSVQDRKRDVMAQFSPTLIKWKTRKSTRNEKKRFKNSFYGIQLDEKRLITLISSDIKRTKLPIGDFWLKLIGLVQRSLAAWHCAAFIRWTRRTFVMALPWWQHHKHWSWYYY